MFPDSSHSRDWTMIAALNICKRNMHLERFVCGAACRAVNRSKHKSVTDNADAGGKSLVSIPGRGRVFDLASSPLRLDDLVIPPPELEDFVFGPGPRFASVGVLGAEDLVDRLGSVLDPVMTFLPVGVEGAEAAEDTPPLPLATPGFPPAGP